MQRLYIKAHLKNGRIIINHELPLDGILYHQVAIEQYGEERYWNEWNNGEVNEDEKNITNTLGKILKIHTDEKLESLNPYTGEIFTHNNKNAGVYLASSGMYQVKKEVIENIRKRFEEAKFEIFGLAKRKIYTTMGQYKNYDIKRRVIIAPCISWSCVGDKEEIERILNQIKFIGKESNIGYGWVDRWEIKEKEVRAWRYFPSSTFAPFEIQEKRRVHPPYHNKKNLLLCSKRYF